MYDYPPVEEPLTQGDIVDFCPLVSVDEDTAEAESPKIDGSRERVILLTQACDLAQETTSRVQVAVVHEAKTLVDRGILKPGKIRDNVRRHQVYGWYFLPAGNIFPESIADLHDIHTLPRNVLTRLVALDRRVCRLSTPYREYLAQHFAITYMRVGLPEVYPTEPF